MKTLFDKDDVVASNLTQLKITKKKGNTLSKSQQTFNTLIKKIDSLNKAIEEERQRCERLLKEYSKDIPKKKVRLAENQISIAKLLGNIVGSTKFSLKQRENIKTVIQWFCSEAFSVIEPDDATKAFYDKWADMSYDEELNDQKNNLKNTIAEQLKSAYGFDIDLSDLDDTPESFARLQEMLKKEMEANEPVSSPKRKKTKKQLEKEASLKKEESEKTKSIRNIYISLAKMLHPDTVTGEKEKSEREEIMKKITVAYNEKNLSELLKLELQWIASEGSHIDNLTEQKLQLYILNLKEQVAALQNEKLSILGNPRYLLINDYLLYTEKAGMSEIKNLSKTYNSTLSSTDYIVDTLADNPPKKTVLEFVKEWIDEIRSDNEDYDFEFPF